MQGGEDVLRDGGNARGTGDDGGGARSRCAATNIEGGCVCCALSVCVMEAGAEDLPNQTPQEAIGVGGALRGALVRGAWRSCLLPPIAATTRVRADAAVVGGQAERFHKGLTSLPSELGLCQI